MSKLTEILAFIQAGIGWAAVIPGAAVPASIAEVLLKIAQSAVQAHEAVTGQPLDLAKLHEIPHVG